MKIEVLYVAGCPSHPAAVQLLRDVLAAHGVAADVREVLVTDGRMANELKFPGSPTIRVNGRDVAGDSGVTRTPGLSCRLYPGAQPSGVPSVELIRRAVTEAAAGDRE